MCWDIFKAYVFGFNNVLCVCRMHACNPGIKQVSLAWWLHALSGTLAGGPLGWLKCRFSDTEFITSSLNGAGITPCYGCMCRYAEVRRRWHTWKHQRRRTSSLRPLAPFGGSRCVDVSQGGACACIFVARVAAMVFWIDTWAAESTGFWFWHCQWCLCVLIVGLGDGFLFCEMCCVVLV